MECINEYGGLNLEYTKPLNEVGSGYTLFFENDIVVAKITPCFENGKGSIAKGLKNQIAFGTTELHVIRTSTEINKSFLFYLTISDVFRKTGESQMLGAGGQKRISDKFIKDFQAPLPSLKEQENIANFLDRTTALIDGLIDKKEKQLKLLVEKRSATISQVVTRGFEPRLVSKDSGIEWLGKIPEHWHVTRIKFIGTIRYGLGEPPPKKADGLPFVRATDIKKGKIVNEGIQFIDPDYIPWSKEPILKAGEILVVRSGAYTGDSAIVTKELEGAVAGYDMVLNCNSANPSFVAFALLSRYLLQGQIFIARSRAAQPHLNAEELGNCYIILPPLNEQSILVDKLNQILFQIDNSIEKITLSISHLREYRSSLINSAVTGQIAILKVETK